MKKYFPAWFAALAIAALAGCLGITPKIDGDNSIAELIEVELNADRQWLLIRGQDRDNPVLLFVHGGPGSPEMNLNHRYGKLIERDFVLAHWDQRGAGKSWRASLPAETMNPEQFIADCHALTLYLKERFHREKIYIVGHSWGSLLGALTAARYPEDYFAYVGVGQVVDLERNESISYEFVMREARERGDKRAIRELEKIGPPPYEDISGLATQRKWLRKFGGFMYGEEGYGDIPAAALTSPEYTAFDHVKYLLGTYTSAKYMWDQLQVYDLIEQVPRLEVPVYFLHGRHDYNTPWELAAEYYEKLDAPLGKTMVWFEQSAHSPNLEEPEKFARVLREQVLLETHPDHEGRGDGGR